MHKSSPRIRSTLLIASEPGPRYTQRLIVKLNDPASAQLINSYKVKRVCEQIYFCLNEVGNSGICIWASGTRIWACHSYPELCLVQNGSFFNACAAVTWIPTIKYLISSAANSG